MPRTLQEIIESQDELADWFERHGPSPENSIPVSEYFLELLGDVQHSGADKICGAVELARDAGATWQQVGEVLGLPAEAAREQFGEFAASASAASAPAEPPAVGAQ